MLDLNFIFARCADCGYPIRNAADARQYGTNYFCPACYELERRRPYMQLNLFSEDNLK